ncbi:MAG TPA: zf-HC2 domain-containing protein [Acidobacteriaceae bacterium]|jgi:hypothetical protein|nr:zf-HC2 domain-containing protein [Acidobacteriaceae bacterium]
MTPSFDLNCKAARAHFSAYLDGAVSGTVMQSLGRHLESCGACGAEFAQWWAMQRSLAALGPAKAPADLALRLRVALSHESAQSSITWLDRLELAWRNTIAPLALQASTGLASAVILLGTVALLLGVVSVPEQAVANDEPTGGATAPRFLYTSVGSDTRQIASGTDGQPVVVQALVNTSGNVYDYRIVSGTVTDSVRALIENRLLFSKFEPAMLLGEPTRGRILLSFTDISVRG